MFCSLLISSAGLAKAHEDVPYLIGLKSYTLGNQQIKQMRGENPEKVRRQVHRGKYTVCSSTSTQPHLRDLKEPFAIIRTRKYFRRGCSKTYTASPPFRPQEPLFQPAKGADARTEGSPWSRGWTPEHGVRCRSSARAGAALRARTAPRSRRESVAPEGTGRWRDGHQQGPQTGARGDRTDPVALVG